MDLEILRKGVLPSTNSETVCAVNLLGILEKLHWSPDLRLTVLDRLNTESCFHLHPVTPLSFEVRRLKFCT